eukprot:scaffold324_cov326-Pavlova_lutheri.AAC.47
MFFRGPVGSTYAREVPSLSRPDRTGARTGRDPLSYPVFPGNRPSNRPAEDPPDPLCTLLSSTHTPPFPLVFPSHGGVSAGVWTRTLPWPNTRNPGGSARGKGKSNRSGSKTDRKRGREGKAKRHNVAGVERKRRTARQDPHLLAEGRRLEDRDRRTWRGKPLQRRGRVGRAV